MGAAIATILLGPWAATIVMTTVVSVQAAVLLATSTPFQELLQARRAFIDLLRDLPMTMLVSSHDLAMVRECSPPQ